MATVPGSGVAVTLEPAERLPVLPLSLLNPLML